MGVIAASNTVTRRIHALFERAIRPNAVPDSFNGSADAGDAILAGTAHLAVLRLAHRPAQYAVELADKYLKGDSIGEPKSF